MAVAPSKEKRVKRLETQLKKYESNPKIVGKIKGRMASLKSSK